MWLFSLSAFHKDSHTRSSPTFGRWACRFWRLLRAHTHIHPRNITVSLRSSVPLSATHPLLSPTATLRMPVPLLHCAYSRMPRSVPHMQPFWYVVLCLWYKWLNALHVSMKTEELMHFRDDLYELDRSMHSWRNTWIRRLIWRDGRRGPWRQDSHARRRRRRREECPHRHRSWSGETWVSVGRWRRSAVYYSVSVDTCARTMQACLTFRTLEKK